MKELIFSTTELSADSYRELLPDFFEEINADFTSLSAAFDDSQVGEMRRLAHKLKGCASSYSADLILDKARFLQDTIDTKDLTSLKNKINELGDSISVSYSYAKQHFNIG